jgi:hypothetical protein
MKQLAGPFGDAGTEYPISEDYKVDRPSGDGKPDCEHCLGRGVIDVPVEFGPPATRPCRCVRARDILINMEKGWRGLSRAVKVTRSPLEPYPNKDLWVTCSRKIFQGYLRYVARVQGPGWRFRVITDADLMNAWLATAKLKGVEIFDYEIASTSISPGAMTLDDLVSPHPFLIIMLGVKAARNEAMPEVLLEALVTRCHEDKPTWLVDQPYLPLEPGHKCWSEELEIFIEQEWEPARLDLSERDVEADLVGAPEKEASSSKKGNSRKRPPVRVPRVVRVPSKR